MARLIVKKGQDEGMSFEIRSSHFSMGRDLANDVQLLFPKVSRVHAEITFRDGEYIITDKNSRNGTLVNGTDIEEKVLEDGDTIHLGDTVFVFMREKDDISRPGTNMFDSEKAGRETVINSVSSWNVDLLKKNLISNSQLELQDTKKYLVDLYEFTRKFAEFDDEVSLLSYTAKQIRDLIKADRVFPLVRESGTKKEWNVISADEMPSKSSLAAIPISSTIFNRTVDEKISLITRRDSSEDEASESMITYDIHTALCTPVCAEGDKGDVIAVLYADRLGGGDNFEKIELEFVTACAIVVAGALRDIKRRNEHLRHEHILKQEVRSRYNIIGESGTIRNVLDFIEKAGGSDAGVLIMGESGTGKELIARAVHYVSDRSTEVFTTCNCAALSETLLESELFGHVKGAFTGAESEKPGVFETADRGTLFLDEIGEMSQIGQAKLLRVLEHGEVCRVGGTEIKQVDVRVIAATNKDLEKEVKEKRFRKDLFHRLNILTVTVAPLREREGDVEFLLQYYTSHFSAKIGRNIRISDEAARLLAEYSWPGNVRELKNFVERTFILSEKDVIEKGDLPANIVYSEERETGSLTLDDVIRRHILKVLDAAGGNKKKAADMLDIDRSTLYSKLKTYEEKEDN